MARFTKGKTFTSTEQVTSTKLHQLIDDAAIAIDTFNIIWPVGSVYTSILSTNPNTTFGFGTWSAFGDGRTLVGLDAGQTEFDTVEETGGAKTHALITAELAAHTHSISASGTTSSSGTHTHTIAGQIVNGSGALGAGIAGSSPGNLTNTQQYTGSDGNHTHTVTVTGTSDSTGSGTAHNNLQPYIVVYFWKRTA
jgi:microcystin-dependent protein